MSTYPALRRNRRRRTRESLGKEWRAHKLAAVPSHDPVHLVWSGFLHHGLRRFLKEFFKVGRGAGDDHSRFCSGGVGPNMWYVARRVDGRAWPKRILLASNLEEKLSGDDVVGLVLATVDVARRALPRRDNEFEH